MDQKAYPRVNSVWWTGKEFLDQAKYVEGNISFFCPFSDSNKMSEYMITGQYVLVMMQFLDRNVEISMHAKIVERIESEGRNGLELLGVTEERQRQEFIIKCARGEDIAFTKRKSERVTCFFPTTVTIENEDFKAWSLNISVHGTFVALQKQLPRDTRVDLVMDFPGSTLPFKIAARVKAVVTESLQPGMGLEFLFESADQRAALVDLVKELQEINSGMGSIELLDDIE